MEIGIKWKSRKDQSILYRRVTLIIPLAKKQKELKESAKTQKAAAIATANEMARQIFQERNINSSKTEKQQHLQEIKQLTDKVKELNKQLKDKQSSIEAKRVVVSNLEE